MAEGGASRGLNRSSFQIKGMEEKFSVTEAEQGHLPGVKDEQNHFQCTGA
jgi:hypothetical protein